MDTYKINIAGVERDLIKYPVSDKLDIAAFILFLPSRRVCAIIHT